MYYSIKQVLEIMFNYVKTKSPDSTNIVQHWYSQQLYSLHDKSVFNMSFVQ